MERIVKFETALLLKEKGYYSSLSECTMVYIPPSEELVRGLDILSSINNTSFVVAPSLSEAQEWLRDVFKLHTAVYRFNGQWCNQIYCIRDNHYLTIPKLFNSYYDALENGIVESLNNYLERE